MTEPAGIDIVTAEAKVDGDVLAVTYTMNGPISLVPEPFFNLLQGDMSAPQYTFELRTEPTSNGDWGLTLITFDTGTDVRKQLTTPVTVTGNTAQLPGADEPAPEDRHAPVDLRGDVHDAERVGALRRLLEPHWQRLDHDRTDRDRPPGQLATVCRVKGELGRVGLGHRCRRLC